eukprot:13101088-Ditylum_brightwellii.AAC.2
MMPHSQATNTQSQVNNATVGSGTRNDDQTTVTLNVSGQEINQVRAANFLQLVNNNYVLRNSTLKLSSNIPDRMSVQSFQQQSNYKGNLWIDSGTNMNTMGRSFKMIEESGTFTNMTGFANDLMKNNVPIGSGLTCCVNKSNGFQFLLGLHEAPYLENNESLLLSVNQSCEASIWLAHVLCCHGGDQRLVAPVENSEEILDLDLEVKDRLLAIECSHPFGTNLCDLPRVCLTGNGVPWDPTIFDEESDVRVLLCWNGESEFEEANNNDA